MARPYNLCDIRGLALLRGRNISRGMVLCWLKLLKLVVVQVGTYIEDIIVIEITKRPQSCLSNNYCVIFVHRMANHAGYCCVIISMFTLLFSYKYHSESRLTK